MPPLASGLLPSVVVLASCSLGRLTTSTTGIEGQVAFDIVPPPGLASRLSADRLRVQLCADHLDSQLKASLGDIVCHRIASLHCSSSVQLVSSIDSHADQVSSAAFVLRIDLAPTKVVTGSDRFWWGTLASSPKLDA